MNDFFGKLSPLEIAEFMMPLGLFWSFLSGWAETMFNRSRLEESGKIDPEEKTPHQLNMIFITFGLFAGAVMSATVYAITFILFMYKGEAGLGKFILQILKSPVFFPLMIFKFSASCGVCRAFYLMISFSRGRDDDWDMFTIAWAGLKTMLDFMAGMLMFKLVLYSFELVLSR